MSIAALSAAATSLNCKDFDLLLSSSDTFLEFHRSGRFEWVGTGHGIAYSLSRPAQVHPGTRQACLSAAFLKDPPPPPTYLYHIGMIYNRSGPLSVPRDS